TIERVGGVLEGEPDTAGNDEIRVGSDNSLEIESVIAPGEELRIGGFGLVLPELRVFTLRISHLRRHGDHRFIEVEQVTGRGIVEHNDALRIARDLDLTLLSPHDTGLSLGRFGSGRCRLRTAGN